MAAEHAGDHIELLADMGRVGLSEDGADRRGNHVGVALGDLGEHVAQEMHPAALPGRAEQDGLDRVFEPGVGIGDDQLHAAQPAGLQAAQERGPKRAVLAVADIEPKHLAPPIRGHAGGHHDRTRYRPAGVKRSPSVSMAGRMRAT